MDSGGDSQVGGRIVIEMDGTRIVDLPSFFRVIGEAINGPNGYFGENMHALSDCLRGGMGSPDELWSLRWKNSEASRRALGYEETARRYREWQKTQWLPERDAWIQDAEQGRGETLFDTILRIFDEESAYVTLILD